MKSLVLFGLDPTPQKIEVFIREEANDNWGFDC